MTQIKLLLTAWVSLYCLHVNAQKNNHSHQGKLFIIGGGNRPPALMQSLAKTAALKGDDYAVVLPMSGAAPDTSFYYFKEDWKLVSDKSIANFNFTPASINYKPWIDSLKNAALIFITGGDQDRFMKAVENTPVYEAIHHAYKNGATIAGTSAGAAVMSTHMITGRQLTDTAYHPTFKKLVAANIEFRNGLRLLNNAIIDQHFIVRSRYNRLISALAAYPSLTCIGIDEATAIIVEGNKISVAGGGQVVVISNPQQLKTTADQLIKFTDLRFSIYTQGDQFSLPLK